jgi:hypothetical protein
MQMPTAHAQEAQRTLRRLLPRLKAQFAERLADVATITNGNGSKQNE